jgi:hypothetical protein
VKILTGYILCHTLASNRAMRALGDGLQRDMSASTGTLLDSLCPHGAGTFRAPIARAKIGTIPQGLPTLTTAVALQLHRTGMPRIAGRARSCLTC